MLSIIGALFVLTSCGNRYKNVSEYRMNPTALKDGERIKLLFAMVGNTDNQEDKYYNQIIAVSQESGDTCNILVPVNHGLTLDDDDKIFNYFSPTSQNAKMGMLDPENLANFGNIDSIKAEFPKYNKVIYDPKNDDWFKNDFPTVMGLIGTQN